YNKKCDKYQTTAEAAEGVIRMMKRTGTVAACAVLAFTLAACGGNNGNNAANEPAANNSAVADNGAAAAGNVVNLTATNYTFDQKEYKVKAGEVTFNLNNAEGVHGIKISNTDVK